MCKRNEAAPLALRLLLLPIGPEPVSDARHLIISQKGRSADGERAPINGRLLLDFFGCVSACKVDALDGVIGVQL